MPGRNTGGRRAGAGSQSMMNFKGYPDYAASNIQVLKNFSVGGGSTLGTVNTSGTVTVGQDVNVNSGSVTANNINADVSMCVPVVAAAPSTANGGAEKAGLILVSTADTSLYMSVADGAGGFKWVKVNA